MSRVVSNTKNHHRKVVWDLVLGLIRTDLTAQEPLTRSITHTVPISFLQLPSIVALRGIGGMGLFIHTFKSCEYLIYYVMLHGALVHCILASLFPFWLWMGRIDLQFTHFHIVLVVLLSLPDTVHFRLNLEISKRSYVHFYTKPYVRGCIHWCSHRRHLRGTSIYLQHGSDQQTEGPGRPQRIELNLC